MHVSTENIYRTKMHKKLDMVMAVYNLLVSDARSHERIFFYIFSDIFNGSFRTIRTATSERMAVSSYRRISSSSMRRIISEKLVEAGLNKSKREDDIAILTK